MAALTFKFFVTGDKECDKILDDLEKKDARKLIKKAVREGIKVVARSYKAKIPRDTGEWYKSIKVKAFKPNRKRFGYMMFINWTKLRNPEEFYPAYNEFGWRDRAPNPIMRQAYDENVKKVQELMKQIILKGLDAKSN